MHRKHVGRTLHRPDTIEKGRELRQSKEFRAMMSARMSHPEMKQALSERAKLQWEDETYKEYMAAQWLEFYNKNETYREEVLEQLNQAQRNYWSDEANRLLQAERVRIYFESHPDAREAHSQRAKHQWQDEELLAWRREKTQQQWTPDFRAKRQAILTADVLS